MNRYWIAVAVLVGAASLAGRSEAFTPKEKDTVGISASGVEESTSFDASKVVVQGTGEPGTPGVLGFDPGGNNFRDSEEAIKVEVDTNLAANRVIIYTSNLSAEADPKFCEDTAKGNDGGGLVGIPTADDPDACKRTVPLVWGVTDANEDYGFTKREPGVGATNGVFITDLAHVATFTDENSEPDNLAMEICSTNAPQENKVGDGLYPQFFGGPSVDLDLCRLGTDTKVLEAEELSKNIAVVAFSFLGKEGLATNTKSPGGRAVDVTSPIYVAMGADFRKALEGSYQTTTLTVELVTQ